MMAETGQTHMLLPSGLCDGAVTPRQRTSSDRSHPMVPVAPERAAHMSATATKHAPPLFQRVEAVARKVEQVGMPRTRAGRLECPRCGGRLMRDDANLLCILCGYEYDVAQFTAGLAHGAIRRDRVPSAPPTI